MISEQDYFNGLLEGVEAERREEELFYKSILSSSSNKEKVENGFAWYPVEILSKRYAIGEYLEVELERPAQTSGNHRIREGAGVSLFNIQGNQKIEFSGIVSWLRKNKMRIILQDGNLDRDEIPEKGLTGVELVYDERPYKAMKMALQEALNSDSDLARYLKSLLRGIDSPVNHTAFNPSLTLPPYLNDSQKLAIQACTNAEFLSLVHGPPGTGKTTTIVELIRSLAQKEKRILVCAPSNNAVDLLAERISFHGVDVMRFGNITRIGEKVMHLTLEEKVKSGTDWQHIKKVRIQADEAEKMAAKFRRSFGSAERAERYAMRKEARDLRKWARELEHKLTRDVVSETKVIVSTLVGASHEDLSRLNFDTVVIDESSQALEAESWIAVLKGKRLVLVGDHKQLSPTVKSRKAQELGLSTTLMDKLIYRSPEVYLLNEQYRMHQRIMSFSNQKFYGGQLKAAGSVAEKSWKNMQPLAFIDTAGAGFDEKFNSENKSYYNDGEFFILREHLLAHKEKLAGAQIGVICPYAEQTRFITHAVEQEEELKGMQIEVDTIDGFQGQEKDVIYLSLVRSNDRGEIGFLADERRLNVALTRARMLLVVIGDSATLGANPLFAEFLDHCENLEALDSAWNYMNSLY